MTFKIHSIATICTVLLTTATAIHAQETSSPEVANPSIATESVKIDPQTLEKFNQAHSALLSIRQEFSQELSTVTNQQEAEAIQMKAQEKMIEAVEETGLSIEQYGEVIAMLQNNPELSEHIFGNSRPVK
ncbi:DUF4168 domain-containing protein [Methylotuvimicrobium buryatense]|uniref:DUF4168 domain-containing protein n=1 Tax=Methylotuvimicrobium buryatense TaxID=95641 RepID=A0A4P9UUZ6_METBY|nr:DUF4168 domain-containing protein [Methylotuvimicrobium buryatense]QCW83516.1 DUF4168 domain-containing protein [Methylotuvimicrobium buryatense]